jgi:hypothetical protein
MHASDICPSWIDEVLHESGMSDRSLIVTDVDTWPIGAGQVADSTHANAQPWREAIDA